MKDYNISKLFSLVNSKTIDELTYRLEDYPLTFVEYRLLYALYFNDGCSQEKLKESLNLDKSIITKVVVALEEKGYLYRKEDLKDKRSKKVYLLDEGKNSASLFNDVLDDFESELFSGLSVYEQRNLKFLLKILNNNLNKMNLKNTEQIK